MLDNDWKPIPRTYSIKSYKKRKSFGVKDFFKVMTYLAVLSSIIGITFISVFQMI